MTMVNAQILGIVALVAVAGSGYGSTRQPILIGPYAVSGSGEFLFCGVKRGNNDRRCVIVPLKEDGRKAQVLSFPGADRCLGAAWRPGAHPDELLFVTGSDARDMQTIKRLAVSSTGIKEISSYALDPNLLVNVQFDYWNPKGTVFALRVRQFGKGAGPYSCIGFSKDNGKTISVSTIRHPTLLSWVTDTTLAMTHVIDADETTGSKVEVMGLTTTGYQVYTMAMSKAELNVDTMTPTVQEILRDKNIALAAGNLHGALVYEKGGTLFRDGQVLAVMPEGVERVFIDGDYIAAVSADGRKLFTLDTTGKILSTKETREESICFGISAAGQCAYLTSSSVENRVKIYAYDLLGKDVKVVFEAASLF